MNPKVRIEINPDGEEETVIHCRELTEEVLRIKTLIESGDAPKTKSLILTLQNTEYIVPVGEILFFESRDGRTAAHTAERMLYTDETLLSLTDKLGSSFFRASKSCIVNLQKIGSLKRELTGICEARFIGCDKTVYISRMYYQSFRERLTEVRLGK